MAAKTGPKPKPIAERIWQRITITDAGCWDWPNPNRQDGYGRIWIGSATDGTRRIRTAHQVAYEEFEGPIPDGLVLDHLCRNTACVNPDHLEPVTQRENVMRGLAPTAENAAKAHCLRGHEFTEANTYRNKGKRYCRTCRAAAWAA